MREILFRGKSIDGGFWVEGSLRITTHQPTDGKPYKCYEIEDTTYGEFPDDFMSGICETVDPETVGQYTGLTDKNGNKIFEGDIVKAVYSPTKNFIYESYAIGKVIFENGTFKLYVTESKNATEYKKYDISNSKSFSIEHNFLNRKYILEVIGNIHDNPELLEV